MRIRLIFPLAGAGLLAAAALFAAPQAVAQAFPGSAGAGFLNQRNAAPAPKEVAPPALPGNASRSGAAPSAKLPTDMQPTDALFDAINRGDIAAARDALSRGADLNAHNVLGMTPMELAVDLGRNDIAFLLLSMRGTGSSASASAAPPPPASEQPAAPPPARAMKAAAKVKAAPVAPPPSPQRARLFAHDGGTPVPSLGFLGFDPERGIQ
jgi:hypothetical protein